MSQNVKRTMRRLLKEEEGREGRSIFIFGVPHSDEGADYEANEIQRAWPIDIIERGTNRLGL